MTSDEQVVTGGVVVDYAPEKVKTLLANAANLSPDAAAEVYRDALTLDPRSEEAYAALTAHLQKTEQWQELVDVNLNWAEHQESLEKRREVLTEVSKIFETQLEAPKSALEVLLAAWGQDLRQSEVAAQLRQLAAEHQLWPQLIEAGCRAAQEASEPSEKSAAWTTCGRWYLEDLERVDYAVTCLRSALDAEPRHREALWLLCRCMRSQGDFEALARTLNELVLGLTGKEKATRLLELAEVYTSRLSRPELAVTCFRRAVEDDPESEEALRGLESWHRRQEDWIELEHVLRRVGEVSEEAAARGRAWQEAGQLAWERKAYDQASSAYRRVLADDPSDLPALRALQQVYEQQDEWRRLDEVLQQREKLCEVEQERIEVLHRLADLWQNQFRKPLEAAGFLEKALEVDASDESALARLPEIYQESQKFDALADLLERKARQTSESSARSHAYQGLGDVVADRLHDLPRALAAFESSLSAQWRETVALRRVELLIEANRKEESLAALAELERQAKEPQTRAQALYQKAQLQHKSSDIIASLNSALAVVPIHRAALERLQQLYEELQSWPRLEKVLESLTSLEPNPAKKAQFMLQRAEAYGHMGEEAQARELRANAFALQADDALLALRVAEEHRQVGDLQQAQRILQDLSSASIEESAQPFDVYLLLGQVALKNQDAAAAERAFVKANERRPRDFSCLAGLAEAYAKQDKWDEAKQKYEEALALEPDAEERRTLNIKQGKALLELGQAEDALASFDAAAAITQEREALEGRVLAYQELDRVPELIQAKRELLDVSSAEEQYVHWLELGDLWFERLTCLQRALECARRALQARPDDARARHRLIGLYQQTNQWRKMVETLERVQRLEPSGEARAKYTYTMGVIYRDELKEPDAALRAFQLALDAIPGNTRASQAVEKLLVQQEQYEELRAHYERLATLPDADDELRASAWYNVARVCVDHLKQPAEAIAALDGVLLTWPDHPTAALERARLLVQAPEGRGGAMEALRSLALQKAHQREALGELYAHHQKSDERDAAWCVAHAMSFANVENAEATQFHLRHRTNTMLRPSRALSVESRLKLLRHSDEDPYLGEIAKALVPAVFAIKRKSDQAYGLRGEQKVDFKTSTATFAQAFLFTARVLAVGKPRLFLRPDVAGGLAYAFTEPPSSVCGSTLLSGIHPRSLTFLLGKHLYYYSGAAYLCRLLPEPRSIRRVILAALRLSGIGAPDAELDKTAQRISQRLPSEQLESLRRSGLAFARSGHNVDVKRWMVGVELSACRAGLLLSADLELAAQTLAAEPSLGEHDWAASKKVEHLLHFSISDAYLELRRELGLEVGSAKADKFALA